MATVDVRVGVDWDACVASLVTEEDIVRGTTTGFVASLEERARNAVEDRAVDDDDRDAAEVYSEETVFVALGEVLLNVVHPIEPLELVFLLPIAADEGGSPRVEPPDSRGVREASHVADASDDGPVGVAEGEETGEDLPAFDITDREFCEFGKTVVVEGDEVFMFVLDGGIHGAVHRVVNGGTTHYPRVKDELGTQGDASVQQTHEVLECGGQDRVEDRPEEKDARTRGFGVR
jgi:hypothetical protein